LEQLAEVWENHLPALYAHLKDAWGITKGKGAEGIVSAARHRLLARRPVLRFPSIAAVMGYLRLAIDSEVADRYGKIGKRLVGCDEQALEALAQHSGSTPSAEDLVIEAEDREQMARLVRRLLAAIQELPPKQRVVVELRCLGDETPELKEIADELGIGEEAAKKRWQRARAYLRRIFGLD
jgi:RNA polymerase sigma factor (sigma-70 family)